MISEKQVDGRSDLAFRGELMVFCKCCERFHLDSKKGIVRSLCPKVSRKSGLEVRVNRLRAQSLPSDSDNVQKLLFFHGKLLPW